MKILVTVGTTIFDSLIKFIDEKFHKNEYEIIFQISEGKYTPKNFSYFRYSENIDFYYENCDVVITHAGAGSVYRLLELKKKIIIIPNIERVDKHQVEIAEYMNENGHALMCSDINEINFYIDKIMNAELKFFKKEDFFVHFHIGEMIKKIYIEENIYL
jgi:beta-1,4-N-acetylglucosaminyltransferase